MVEIVDCKDVVDYSPFVARSHRIFADLVEHGAALGWLEPPNSDEISFLLKSVIEAARDGDAAMYVALAAGTTVGLGYWRRYRRPTHYPHADIERIAVDKSWHGRGIGRLLTEALIDAAVEKEIEVLTLDVRGDNANAIHLYRRLGFEEYGVLRQFVAVGPTRYDKHFFSLDLRARHGLSAATTSAA